MFDDNTIRMAKELAGELVRVDKKRNHYINAFEDVRKVVSEIYNEIKQQVREVWDFFHNEFSEKENHCKYIVSKKDYYNWHVPMKIGPPKLPHVELPKVNLARSNL